MSRVVVIENVTLDGVMQAPGRPDEDTRGGFRHGGWATMPNEDPDIGRAMGERMAQSGPMLFGRRTYEDFYGYRPPPEGQSVHGRPERGAQVRRLPHPRGAAALEQLRAARGRRGTPWPSSRRSPVRTSRCWEAESWSSRSCTRTSSMSTCSSFTRSCSGRGAVSFPRAVGDSSSPSRQRPHWERRRRRHLRARHGVASKTAHGGGSHEAVPAEHLPA